MKWINKFKEYFKELSLEDMQDIMHDLKTIKSNKYHSMFKVVNIISDKGNITDEIWEKYKLSAIWKCPTQKMEHCCGTNLIEIPVERLEEPEIIKLLKDYEAYE